MCIIKCLSLSFYWTTHLVRCLSPLSGTSGKLSEGAFVLKWKSDVHFRSKTGLLLKLILVYLLFLYKQQELNKNLDVLGLKMIAG